MADSFVLCRNCGSGVATPAQVPTSQVPHLLGTNKAPSDTEARNIRASITAVRRDISLLDADIAHAQRVIEKLTKEREVLKVYMNDHAAVLSPTRQVPAEIWSNIFLHCLPEIDFIPTRLSRGMFFSPKVAPTVLLRVCTDWATIALSTPRLWSRIVMLPHKIYPPSTEHIILKWLERSKQAPLSVFLGGFFTRDCSDEAYRHGVRFSLSCVRQVLEQSYRWKEARITLPAYSLHMYSSIKNNLPELEELHLTIHVPLNNRLSEDASLFWDAPKLRRVTIGYCHRPLTLLTYKLPWAQLTHLTVRDEQSMNALCILLQLAPNLSDVDWCPQGTELLPPEAVEHSRLRDLSLHFKSHTSPQFFDRLFFPSLCTLSIHAPKEVWSSPHFLSFLSRNSQALEKFELHTASRYASQVVICLRALQTISHISLSIYDKDTTTRPYLNHAIKVLLRALYYLGGSTAEQEDSLLLPRLKIMTLQCNDGPEVVNDFIGMVESRWRSIPVDSHGHDLSWQSGISRIEAASLIIRSSEFPFKSADFGRVRRLQSEGLAVQVSFESYLYPELLES